MGYSQQLYSRHRTAVFMWQLFLICVFSVIRHRRRGWHIKKLARQETRVAGKVYSHLRNSSFSHDGHVNVLSDYKRHSHPNLISGNFRPILIRRAAFRKCHRQNTYTSSNLLHTATCRCQRSVRYLERSNLVC